MPRAAIVALLCVSLLVAGCGGGTASGGGEPASAVPRDAAVYLEATVRPDGSLRDDALAAAGKILRTDDPRAKIDELVARAFAESEQPKLDYERDVKPWLGEKVGLWVAPGGGERDFRGAIVASATDTDAARAAIDRAVEGSERTFRERSYEGVDYRASDKGAAGVVEDFAVFGTEAEFKRTVDAIKGDGLQDDDRFRKATDGLPDERLGTFYVDVRALVAQAKREDPGFAHQIEQAERLVPLDRVGPVAGALEADGERLAVDAGADVPEDAAAGRLGALAGGGPTPLLEEVPADAWLALGLPKLGETAKLVYRQTAGAIGSAAIEGRLRSELGLDLQEDVFSWIGDAAFFMRGTSEDALERGAVIEVTDPTRAKAAFGKLIGLAQTRGGVSARPVTIEGADTAFALTKPGEGKPLIAARTDERVVIASADAAAEVLGSGDRLGDGDTYAEARSALGGDLEPGLVVAMPALLELVSGHAGDDPDFAKAEPYLQAFDVIASSSENKDGRVRMRATAGLR